MKYKEFIDYVTELQNYYNQELNETEVEIWYESLKFMTVERFNYILSELYKINRFMPKLSEVLDMHKQIPYTVGKQEKNINGHCEKCNDTGYIIYTKIINNMPYKYTAVCDCGRQDRYDGRQCVKEKDKSDYYIPTIQEIGLEVKSTRPTDGEIIKSMNMLKNSSIISENIKNIIRENFRNRRVNK